MVAPDRARRIRPRAGPGRILLATLGVLGAAGLAGCATTAAPAPPPRTQGSSAASTTSTAAPTTGPGPTTPTTSPSIKTRPAAPRVDDGSLGSRPTRIACKLLDRAQIQGQFGAAVGLPTPTYPYCQWLVGKDAFLALAVFPHMPYAADVQWVTPLVTINGLGQSAMIGNNRYLYFYARGTSYYLLYQKVGDFSGLYQPQLEALARDVLARPLPAGAVGLPPQTPPGPPILFVGDSTAAGPEWAWDAYHVNSPALATLAEYQVGSGLVVPAYFDWPRHLLALVAERRPKLVIYMGSANDGQDLVVDGADQAPGTPLWRAAYGRIVGGIMAEVTAEGSKLLWIGEPAMQDPVLNAAMAAVDHVCAAEAAKHPGVTWFNPGAVLNGPDGQYEPSLMIGGQLTQVRLDGVHLNVAGSIYLANYIAAEVHRILG